ncbi:MAG: helix-turn-helix transcriptional regulator [Lachnospiraceae bacterium]|nr:helix-turn-helix transcriptional regulator [Lachnospiraceae bacterium]
MKIYHYEGKANIIGPQIKLARINQHLTQEELAIKMQLRNIEISQKVISRIEKQERFVADYELLAFSEVLKMDLYELFSLKK